MSKLGDVLNGRAAAITVSAVLLAAVVGGVGTAVAVSNAEQGAAAVVVETVAPVDVASVPYTNGLAAEQETDAAAAVAEQARLAAEAEAARIAAEAAAAAEAQRVAAEQAVAESYEEPAADERQDPAGDPATWVPSTDPNNRNGGGWDTSGCASGRFETGADGVPVCLP